MKLYFDEKIEKFILGAIILEPLSIHKITDIMKPEYFYNDNHRHIYKSCLELIYEGKGIDYIQVIHKTKDKNIEPYFVTTLTTNVASAKNIESHTQIIADLYIKREMYKTAASVQKKIANNEDIQDILDFQYKKLIEHSEIGNKQNVKHISEAINDIEQQQLDMLNGSPDVFNTNLSKIDDVLKIQRSDLIVLAARPSVGKTAISLNFAKNYAKNGKKVGVFSLEMSYIQLTKRIISSEAHINSNKFDNFLNDSDSQKFNEFKKPLQNLEIYIDDTSSLTVLKLGSKVRELKIKHDIDIIIIDYIQLMSGVSKGNREQDISEISRGLKILAKDLNIPIIVLSQLNRNLEQRSGDKRPKLSDLRESGAIEQDADIVLFLYSPAIYGIDTDADGNKIADGFTELICRKYRNGGLFTSELIFQKDIQKFYDYNGTDVMTDEIFETEFEHNAF